MTKEEMEKKRDEDWHKHFWVVSSGQTLLQIKEIHGESFKAGWDACAEEYEKEVERLHKIISKELSENDDLGSEFTYVFALKKEIKRAEDELNYLKDKIKEFIFFVGSK